VVLKRFAESYGIINFFLIFLTLGIEEPAGRLKVYDFLRDDSVQYTPEDLKEKY
jgi:hypothetical protein